MLNIRRILYATDFSETSEHALPWALHLAAEHGAELHMLHAVVLHADEPTHPAHYFPDLDRVQAEIEKQVEARMLAAVEREDDPRIQIRRVYRRGISAAPVILGYADEEDIDLIVVGTHGRRGLRHFLLGSVAEEVLRLAECPVLAVRMDKDLSAGLEVGRIVVPMDYSADSEVALRHGGEIAALHRADLQLLHVVMGEAMPALEFDVREMLEDYATRARERLEERADSVLGPGVDHEVTVRVGHPVTEITEFAEERNADLVVLSSHGRSGLEHLLLGSVAEGVLRHVHCPVLVVKAHGKSLLAGSAGQSVAR